MPAVRIASAPIPPVATAWPPPLPRARATTPRRAVFGPSDGIDPLRYVASGTNLLCEFRSHSGTSRLLGLSYRTLTWGIPRHGCRRHDGGVRNTIDRLAPGGFLALFVDQLPYAGRWVRTVRSAPTPGSNISLG